MDGDKSRRILRIVSDAMLGVVDKVEITDEDQEAGITVEMLTRSGFFDNKSTKAKKMIAPDFREGFYESYEEGGKGEKSMKNFGVHFPRLTSPSFPVLGETDLPYEDEEAKETRSRRIPGHIIDSSAMEQDKRLFFSGSAGEVYAARRIIFVLDQGDHPWGIPLEHFPLRFQEEYRKAMNGAEIAKKALSPKSGDDGSGEGDSGGLLDLPVNAPVRKGRKRSAKKKFKGVANTKRVIYPVFGSGETKWISLSPVNNHRFLALLSNAVFRHNMEAAEARKRREENVVRVPDAFVHAGVSSSKLGNVGVDARYLYRGAFRGLLSVPPSIRREDRSLYLMKVDPYSYVRKMGRFNRGVREALEKLKTSGASLVEADYRTRRLNDAAWSALRGYAALVFSSLSKTMDSEGWKRMVQREGGWGEAEWRKALEAVYDASRNALIAEKSLSDDLFPAHEWREEIWLKFEEHKKENEEVEHG